MNKLKKILIYIFIFIVVTILIIIINPYKRFRKSQLEKELLEAINNGIIGNDISENFRYEYKFAVNDNTNEYLIDDFIKYYVDLLDTCILIKKGKKNTWDIREFFVRGDFMNLTVTRCSDDRFAKYIVDNITEKDVEAYDNNLYVKMILDDLEKIFIHKSDKDFEDWYLSGNENKIIDLHYNYYITYTPNDKKNNNDFVKLLDFKIISPLNTIDVFDKKNNTLESKIKYITNSGDIKELKRVVILEKKDDNVYYSPEVYLSSLYYSQTIKPTISPGQHDYDAEEERIRKEYPLEGPSTFTNAWEEEIQGITYEPSKVMTVEEIYESLINKYNESTASDAKEKVALFEDLLKHTINNSK